jgi:hypothetical protein
MDIKTLQRLEQGTAMSVYRDKRSPFWQFDFQLRGYRFSGSTGLTDQRDAAAYEANEKAKAREIVDDINHDEL